MSRYSKKKTLYLSDEQWNAMKEAVESGEYANDAAYVRAMINAGRSNIADMDPRTSDTRTQSDVTHNYPSEAAKALSDEKLIDSLERGEDDRQKISEVLTKPSNKFQSQLANRLDELAKEDTSPVQSKYDPDLEAAAYWLKGDEK